MTISHYNPDVRKRNYGFGKNMSWAGKNAVALHGGHGRFCGRASYGDRWNTCARIFKRLGITDARDIDEEAFYDFAETIEYNVSFEGLALTYGHNLISTANVVLRRLRGDGDLFISPTSYLGPRTNVRTFAPTGMYQQGFDDAVAELMRVDPSYTAIVELGNEFGLRLKEATFFDLSKALDEALATGFVWVVEGTKGGRGKVVERKVPARAQGIQLLERLLGQLGRNRALPDSGSHIEWRQGFHRKALPILARHGIASVRDLRSAYACRRYKELTGFDAPVVAGQRLAGRDEDNKARQIISAELGHGRPEVAGAYVGGRR